MKSMILEVFIVCSVLMGVVGFVQAALIPVDDYVYDSSSNKYWIRNVGIFNNLTLDEQLDMISGLPNQINDDVTGAWRLAGYDDISLFFENNYHDIENAFQGWNETLHNRAILSGRVDIPLLYGNRAILHYSIDQLASSTYPTVDVMFNNQGFIYTYVNIIGWIWVLNENFNQYTLDENRNELVGAWVVCDVNVAPIPSALLLLGPGLVGVVAVRRKPKKES